MSVYLDYNASTPVDKRVLEVMINVYQNKFGNADSRTHDYGEAARQVVEDARQSVADIIGVKKDEIFFTSGATESNNIAVSGLQSYGEKSGRKHIITTAVEHKSVLEPLRMLEAKGFEVTYLAPDKSGRINADKLLSMVREDTLLVSVMHVNNETGVIQPVDVIGGELASKNVLFHIDAAQSFGKLVDELKNIKYDMLSASAHKMYGPQGIGALILRKRRYKLPPVSPVMYGGGQEHGIRSGTVPTALIAGFGRACEIAAAEYKENHVKYNRTKDIILKILECSGVSYTINGDRKYVVPNTLNVSFNGVNSEALMLAAKQYCSVSNGSACNLSSYKPSYVLSAMGLDEGTIESAVRMSWGVDCEIEKEILRMTEIIKSF